MQDNIVTVSLGERSVTLIGTAHVSRESIDEVKAHIRDEKPGMVCVELDGGRFKAMDSKDDWERLNVSKAFREGKGFLLIANLVLAGFQRRMGVGLGVKPGEEMLAACDTAKELGIPYRFCDREVQITLRRAWARCGLWSKCKLLASLISSAFSTEKLNETEIENLKQASELDGMMAELASYLPAVKETLIDERDRYLAAKIWTAGQETPAGEKMLAVVGAGHLSGLRTHLEKIAAGNEDAGVDTLDTIPPSSFLAKAAGWIIPIAIAALIVAGFFQAGATQSLSMLLQWVLWNGSLAALGTLIALGHPLSILVSFLGAPIATINPFIGVGLFSGITEAWVRKPRVQDVENIAEDFSSLRGIYRNRVSRALLVFFLSSLGGAVGNFISIPALAGSLFK
ncbi:MAG: TraB/GumN family protein [Treponema sp.]|jgi:pheromone shutdown-related protein TraB|nr:TraB/GumN family protein [Treponema sp.]